MATRVGCAARDTEIITVLLMLRATETCTVTPGDVRFLLLVTTLCWEQSATWNCYLLALVMISQAAPREPPTHPSGTIRMSSVLHTIPFPLVTRWILGAGETTSWVLSTTIRIACSARATERSWVISITRVRWTATPVATRTACVTPTSITTRCQRILATPAPIPRFPRATI